MIVATPAIAWLGFGPLRPAAANARGTTTATPRPSSPKPHIAGTTPGAKTTSTPPTVASNPPTRTVLTAPNRSTTLSPAIRATAIVSANAVVDAAASPAELSMMSRR